MGGTVAVFYRDPQGTIYNMLRWTNVFPEIVLNQDFLDNKKEGIDAFLKSWLLMKKDWEDNQHTRKFENNATEHYGPYPAPFEPTGYGFILIDAISKNIMTSQNYTSFGRIKTDMFYVKALKTRSPDDMPYGWDRLKTLYDMGVLQSFLTTDEKARDLGLTVLDYKDNVREVAFPSHIVSLEDKIAYSATHNIYNIDNLEWAAGDCVITPPNGWTFNDLPDFLDPYEIDDFMGFLASINWPITPQEERAFYAYYRDEE